MDMHIIIRNGRCTGWFDTRRRIFTSDRWAPDPGGFSGCKHVAYQWLSTDYSLTSHNSSACAPVCSWVGSSYRSVRFRSIPGWWWNGFASIEIASGCASSRTMATHTSHTPCKSNPSSTSIDPSCPRNATELGFSCPPHQNITTTTKTEMPILRCSPPSRGNRPADGRIHNSCSSQPGRPPTRTTTMDSIQYKIDPRWRSDQHPQTIRFCPWCRQF